MAQAASLWVKLGISDKDFQQGLKKAENDLKRFGDRLSNLGSKLTTGLSLPLALASGAAIKFGMDVVESESLFSVSMGKMAAAGESWSKQLRKDLGLNEYEIRKNLGVFKTMIESMGLSEQAAFDMSKGLTQLAYDIASFYNLKPEEAFRKLQAGISGESEPLKKLGIIVNETTVEMWALNNGLIKQGEELSEAGKVAARYGVIMEATKKAQGDMARTLDSPANKLRVLTDQFHMAATELGIALLPAVTKFMVALNPLVKIIGDLAQRFSQLDPNLQTIIAGVIAFGVALGPVIAAAGKFYSTLSAFPGLIATLTKTGSNGLPVLIGNLKVLGVQLAFLWSIMLAIQSYGQLRAALIKPEELRNVKDLNEALKLQMNINKELNRIQKIIDTTKFSSKAEEEMYYSQRNALLYKKKIIDTVIEELSQASIPEINVENILKETFKAFEEFDFTKIGGGVDEKATFISEWKMRFAEAQAANTKNLEENAHFQLQILEMEKKEALEKAKKLGADTTDIENTYKLKRLAIEKDLNDKKREFAQNWVNQHLQAQMALVKNLDENAKLQIQALENEKEEAIRIATEQGLSIEEIEKTFTLRRKKIEDDLAKAKQEFALNWKTQLLQSQAEITENIDENARIQLKILEVEKEEAVRKAEEQGLSITEIEQTYANRRATIEKNLNKQKADFAREWQDKLKQIYATRREIIEMERDAALRNANEKGYDTSGIQKYYDLMLSDDFKIRWNMGFSEALRSMETWGESVQSLAKNVASSMQSVFGEFFYSASRGFKDLKDVVQNVVDSILRQMTSMLGNAAFQYFFGSMFGSPTPMPNNAPNGSVPTGRAYGGAVSAGTLYRVNEPWSPGGMEFFKPNVSGQVIPLGSGKAQQLAPQVNIINQTGVQVTTTQQEITFDGERTVMNLWIGAVNRNVGGVQRMLPKGV